MVNVRLYVEGGGKNNKALRSACRRGFREFFQKAGLEGALPRVIPCGGRQAAYDDFCTALRSSERACVLLLVDSEAPVARGDGPWDHLKKRPGDQWDRPKGATDEHCHLMVQCMEAWFLADKLTLSSYFGRGFKEGALPQRPDIENIPKKDIFKGLENATRHTKTKGRYSKGGHSFEILALIAPELVRDASPYADRLLNTLDAI